MESAVPPGDDQNPPQVAEQQEEQQPRKRGRGRPRIWPQERRIEPVREGRMSFQPGNEHQMDVQFKEARSLREDIEVELASLETLMVELGHLDDPGEAIRREETEITQFLWTLYGRRKHREHMLATFLVARRRRQLQRLRAASAALAQARDFLLEDVGMLPRLQQTIAEAEARYFTQRDTLHNPPPSYPEEGEEEAAATVEDALDVEAQKRREDLIKMAGGGDDAEKTREALADLEERTRTMRSAITMGTGRFEWYYQPIPKDDPKDEEEEQRYWGPYLRFVWNEGKIRYQLGMGHIKQFDPTKEDEPPRF
jgi:hypothetical protein